MTIRKRNILKEAMDAERFLKDLTDNEPITIGNTLENVRLCDELTQVNFARKLGISKQHLCDIEKGRKAVSPERAAEFARKLGYPEKQYVALALQDLLVRSGFKWTVSLHEGANDDRVPRKKVRRAVR